MTESANAQLARTIACVLIDEGLVLRGWRSELEERLADGRVTADDWRRWIEEALPREVEG